MWCATSKFSGQYKLMWLFKHFWYYKWPPGFSFICLKQSRTEAIFVWHNPLKLLPFCTLFLPFVKKTTLNYTIAAQILPNNVVQNRCILELAFPFAICSVLKYQISSWAGEESSGFWNLDFGFWNICARFLMDLRPRPSPVNSVFWLNI